MSDDVVVAARARAQSMREGTGAAVTRTPSTHVMLENLAAEIERLRANQQYTCEEHAGEVRKGGRCVWCELRDVRASLSRAEEGMAHAIEALKREAMSIDTIGAIGILQVERSVIRQLGIAGDGSLENTKL